MITAADIAKFIPEAVKIGMLSPCAKSKRGVVIIQDNGVYAPSIRTTGYNAPPAGWKCDGSDECREACNKLCIHAEAAAISALTIGVTHLPVSMHMLHVKVVGWNAVASGPPSCWQCSRMLVDTGLIDRIWLLHDDGRGPMPVAYTPNEFHEQTLYNCGLPVIR